MASGLASAAWLDAYELLETKTEAPDWIVEGFIARGDIAILAAPAGSGKSLMSLDLARSVALGVPVWGGLRVPQPRRVVYLECEMNQQRTARYFKRLTSGADSSAMSLAGRIGFLIGRRFRLDVESDRQRLIGELRDYRDSGPHLGAEEGLDLLVIDSMRRCLNGDEQDSGACDAFFEGVAEVIAALGGPAVLLIHHLRKIGQNDRSEPSERIRGSSDILNAVDHAYIVVSKHGGRHRIETAKSRERAPDPIVVRFDGWEAVDSGAEDHAIPLRLVIEDAVSEVIDKDAETRKAILEYLGVQPNGSATRQMVVKALEGPGRSERVIQDAFRGLERQELTHSSGRGGRARPAIWTRGKAAEQGGFLSDGAA